MQFKQRQGDQSGSGQRNKCQRHFLFLHAVPDCLHGKTASQKKKWQQHQWIAHPLCTRNESPASSTTPRERKKHDASVRRSRSSMMLPAMTATRIGTGLDQKEPQIVSPGHSSQQTRGKIQIKRAVEVVTTVRDAIMVKPMYDSGEFPGKRTTGFTRMKVSNITRKKRL